MDIHEDGTVIEIEKEVDLKDVPKEVTKAIEDKYPKSKAYKAIERDEKNRIAARPQLLGAASEGGSVDAQLCEERSIAQGDPVPLGRARDPFSWKSAKFSAVPRDSAALARSLDHRIRQRVLAGPRQARGDAEHVALVHAF